MAFGAQASRFPKILLIERAQALHPGLQLVERLFDFPNASIRRYDFKRGQQFALETGYQEPIPVGLPSPALGSASRTVGALARCGQRRRLRPRAQVGSHLLGALGLLG